MNPVEMIVGLVFVAVVLATIAQPLRIPYPTLLVLGGLSLSLIPGLPHIQVPPDIAFLVFIPPLVYQVASQFALRDLWIYRWPVFRLSIGLVLLNLLCVAAAAHWGIDGFSWSAAFVLAAIISPTDTAAVTAVTRNLRIPRRVEQILEGESLFNDVVALVAYQQAVKAAVTGLFSPGDASCWLLYDAVGGVGVGCLVGMLATWTRRRLHDTSINTAASLLTPFAAYLGAEAIGTSGVLATVAAGLYVGRCLLAWLQPAERVQAVAFWAGTRFLLEGLAFVLIGFQLRQVLDSLADVPIVKLIRDCALICLVSIVIRILWMVVWTWLPYLLKPQINDNRDHAPVGQAALLAWGGMRGVDSLAAALALPLLVSDGTTPFPQRNLITFVTFSVILTSLVVQGLTLPLLIRWLKLTPDPMARSEGLAVRLTAMKGAMANIDTIAAAIGTPGELVSNLRKLYQLRIEHYEAVLNPVSDGPAKSYLIDSHLLMLEMLKAERRIILAQWEQGLISSETRLRVEREMDYEELKLAT